MRPKSVAVTLFVAYATAWIARTVYLCRGRPFFLMADDALISMKYAYNLANGFGLTWNPGERVEGITNLGWTLVLAVPHILGIGVHWTALFVYAAEILLLVAVAFHSERLAANIGVKRTLLPFVTVLFYYSPFFWGMQGYETALLSLLLLVVLCCNDDRVAIVAGLFGILVRTDFAVMVVASAVCLRRTAVLWSLAALVPISAFRRIYYGDALPNTYYLKLTGYPVLLRMRWGVESLFRFAWGVSPVLAVAMWSGNRRLWTVVLAMFAYSAWVGGDAWDRSIGGANRYICLVMPVVIVMFYSAVERIGGKAMFGWALFLPVMMFLNTPTGMHSIGQSLLVSKQTYQDEFRGMVDKEEYARRVTKPGDTLAVMWAGLIPYYMPDRRYADLLGKCDRHIARLPVDLALNSGPFGPGHNKWDFDYTWRRCNYVTTFAVKMKPDIEKRILDGRAVTVSDPATGEWLIRRVR